jgi:subtilase family serine protease
VFSAKSGKLAFALGAAAVLCLVTAALASSSRSSHPWRTPSSHSDYVVSPVVGNVAVPAGKVSVQGSIPSGGTGCGITGTPAFCYAPADIRQIYNVPAGPDGSGQTIIVLGAYGSPFLQDDLDQFDSTFGIGPAHLTIVGRNGRGDPNDEIVQAWQHELTFDVEWAHAMAPAADIVLVVARSDDSKDLNRALMRALPDYPGAIVSQSFGADETFVRQGFIDDRRSHLIYAGAALLGDTVLASSGDGGASGYDDTDISAEYPASDPFVTAVGGTEGGVGDWLKDPNGLWANGKYGIESAWNDPFGATGGAPSAIFPAPSYQSGVTGNSKRAVPDVAMTASNAARTLFVFGGAVHSFGGTSVGPPIWAGIFALANQQRAAQNHGPLGPANPALYAIAGNAGSYAADFHDIVNGDNIFDPGIGGFSAGTGYDLATGLGTPNVAGLLGDLAAAPGSEIALSRNDRSPDVSCQNQQLTGTYRNVRVQRGSWCDLAGATVFGDVRADGASGLGITSSEIVGDVQASSVSGAADSSHSGVNVICNSVVWGKVQIRQSSKSAPWNIGGSACANAPDVTGGTGSVVGKDLQFDRNAATNNEISGNTVVKDVECSRNGGVTGQDNQASSLDDQCAGLGTATGDDDGDG